MKNLKFVLVSLLTLAAMITVGCGGGGTTFTKLPFASNRTSSTTSLFVMNLDGTNVTPVTNVPVNNFWAPSVDAHLKKVTYMSGNNVWVINADGTGNAQLTSFLDDESDGFSYAYYTRMAPNGKTILFSVWNGTDESDNIWVMNADGSGKKNLTATLPSGMNGCYRASYSGDGKKIAFACYNNTGDAIYYANADGSHATVVVPVTANVFFDIPMFSPDGKKVLFIGYNFTVGGGVIRSRSSVAHSPQPVRIFQHSVAPHGIPNNQGVFSFNLDGTGGTLAVPGTWEAVILNSSMYYTLYDSDAGKDQIWKANADGTGAAKISDGSASDWLAIGSD